MRRPSLKDVAKAAGVHTGTASRALNDRHGIHGEPADHGARARGRRRPRVSGEPGGARLKTSRSFTIGMLVPDITNPFFPPMVRGAGDGLSQAGYTLVLADTDNDPGRNACTRRSCSSVRSNGLLLGRRAGRRIEELITTGLPFVLVNRTMTEGRVGRHPGRPGRHGARGRPPPRARPSDHRPYHGSLDDVDGRSTGGGGGGPFVGRRARPTVEAPSFTVEAVARWPRDLFERRRLGRAPSCANDSIALGALDAAASLAVSGRPLLARRLQRHALRRSAPTSVDDRPRGRSRRRTSGVADVSPSSTIPAPTARRSCSRPELVVRGSTATTV